MNLQKSLFVAVGVTLFTLLLGGCGVAEHSVSKGGRVLAHGERKIEKHL